MGSFRIGISRAEQGASRKFLFRLGGLGGKASRNVGDSSGFLLGSKILGFSPFRRAPRPGNRISAFPEQPRNQDSERDPGPGSPELAAPREIRGRARRSWPLSSLPRRQKVEFWNFSGFAGSRSEIFISAKGSRYRNATGIPIAIWKARGVHRRIPNLVLGAGTRKGGRNARARAPGGAPLRAHSCVS